ncbi:PREDICTED: DNA mismatch repair protein MSH7-like [Camelina sativa]|uniref:DNA mismatch repair protein MSH7-like n=1 Tax=Camelina sativa TaxID=90675 RepID=A0ABM0W8B6_CAMSA|nr:PREDICTED: DNA mismatch repair protein MSH7-like [Camelina sativa]
MQRQRSILSFFQKPSSASKGLVSGDATSGTDTPPEKVPRRVLPSGFKPAESAAGGGASSLFTNIMHKFVKVDDRDCSGARSREHVVPLNDSSVCMKDDNVFPEYRSNNGQSQERGHTFSFSGRADIRPVEDIGVDDDVPGPETPGMPPSISRLKRVLEDGMTSKENKVPVLDSSKRLKMLQDPVCGEKKEVNEGTKFEWLEPSRIRDANRRCPDDDEAIEKMLNDLSLVKRFDA